jgi:Rv0078B-related antitoxin
MTIRSDTSEAAARVQREILSNMSGPDRLLAAMQMSDDAAAATRDGIRHRHPEWSEAEVHAGFLRVTLGEDLAAKVLASAHQGR